MNEKKSNQTARQFIDERNKLQSYVDEIHKKNKLFVVNKTMDIPLAAFKFDDTMKHEVIKQSLKMIGAKRDKGEIKSVVLLEE